MADFCYLISVISVKDNKVFARYVPFITYQKATETFIRWSRLYRDQSLKYPETYFNFVDHDLYHFSYNTCAGEQFDVKLSTLPFGEFRSI